MGTVLSAALGCGLPAGAPTAGMKVWLGKGAHVRMSVAGAAGWCGTGCCRGFATLQPCAVPDGTAFHWKCVAPAPDAGSWPAQPCRCGATEVVWLRHTLCSGAAHS